MMIIQINSVNMEYQDGELSRVKVYFRGQDDENTVSLSGYVPLSAEDYLANPAPKALKSVVRQELIDKLTDDGDTGK